MRLVGRFGLSTLAGCWAVAFWAAAFGASPVLRAETFSWWPGALFSILIAGLSFVALQSLPAISDGLQRAFGGDVALWATAAAIGLLWLFAIRWDAPLSGEAAMEMLAIGLAGMILAGITAPARPARPRPGLPPLAPAPAGSPPAEESIRTLTWTGRGTGYTPVEPYAVDLQIDRVRLEAQRVAPHDLIEARWAAYCVRTLEIAHLAGAVRAISQREHLDRLDEFRLALDLIADGLGPATSDVAPHYPLETLVAEAPGPTARAILALTLLAALGYGGALLRTGQLTALAVTGVVPLTDLFLQVEGEPALFAEFTPDGYICGDVPAGDRAVSWRVVPLRK